MKLLKQENVQIIESASDWQEAIKLSVLPLEKGGYVKECYNYHSANIHLLQERD